MNNLRKIAFAASALAMVFGLNGVSQAGVMTYSERLNSDNARAGILPGDHVSPEGTAYTVTAETVFIDSEKGGSNKQRTSYTLVYNAPKAGSEIASKDSIASASIAPVSESGLFNAVSSLASNSFEYARSINPGSALSAAPAGTVPEPSTIALFALGLAGVFGLRRRAMKKKEMGVSK